MTTLTRAGAPDILLFSPPPWLVSGPPLGLAALSAFLRAEGWNVRVQDGNAKTYRRSHSAYHKLWLWDYSAYWEDAERVERAFGDVLRALAEEAAQIGAPVVGVNVVHRKEAAAAIFLRRLRELQPDVLVFVGGPGAGWRESRDHMRHVAAGLIDGFVVGEGEITCHELLSRIRRGESLDDLPGFVGGDEAGEARYRPGPFLTDMARLPVPDFGDFDMSEYDIDSLVVEWNRGCVARCTYCSINEYWNAFRFKSADAVATELETLAARHGIRRFTVVDPMVNGNPDHLERVCDAIVARRIDVEWSAGFSPNKTVSAEVFRKLRAAGCWKLEFGVDSGSDRILKKMGKRYRADAAGQMIDDAHNAGIQVMLYLIVGFPGETDETVDETIDWLRRHAHAIDMVRSVSSLTIEDGTAVERRSELFGIDDLDRSDTHWRDDWSAGADTPAIRAARVERVLATIRELGITIESELVADASAIAAGPDAWTDTVVDEEFLRNHERQRQAHGGSMMCSSFPGGQADVQERA